jgi:hypothetical protein
MDLHDDDDWRLTSGLATGSARASFRPSSFGSFPEQSGTSFVECHRTKSTFKHYHRMLTRLAWFALGRRPLDQNACRFVQLWYQASDRRVCVCA